MNRNAKDQQALLIRLLVLLLMVVTYCAIPNARPDFTRFNCHDSESYLALSYSLVHGLGYTRSMIPGADVPHTTWPPGVPVLMMPAVTFSGERINWVILKETMALLGITGVVLAWQLGRRWSGTTLGGDVVALCVALNPLYWDFSHQVMAELPLIVWMIGSVLLVDYCWAARKPRWWEALAVGSVCGLGMLIKGHAIGLILAPLAYVTGKQNRSSNRLKTQAALWIVFCLGFVIPFLGWVVRNSTVNATGFDGISQLRMLRAKDPCDANSPLMNATESISIAIANLRHHTIYAIPSQILPGLWFDATTSGKGSGWVYLLLTSFLIAATWPWRKRLFGMHLVIPPIFLLNIQYALGGAARFWVPVSILMIILIALEISCLVEKLGAVRAKAAFGILTVVLSLNLLFYVIRHERQPYMPAEAWAEKAQFFRAVSQMDLQAIGVGTSNCHAFQLMTGLPAPMGTGKADLPCDHVVVRLDTGKVVLPEGAREVTKVFPWVLYALPRPLRASDLRSACNDEPREH